MDNRVKRITAEIAAVVERNLRRELLREREAMLRGELEAIRAELGRTGAGQAVRRAAKKPVRGSRPQPKPPAKPRPVRGDSARALMIRILRYSRRPMTIKELTKAILNKGWKSVRKDPSKTVDVALRHNPRDFRRTAPSTFELNR